jgi:hypothetical protein
MNETRIIGRIYKGNTDFNASNFTTLSGLLKQIKTSFNSHKIRSSFVKKKKKTFKDDNSEPSDSDDDYRQSIPYHKSKACAEHAKVVAHFLNQKNWTLGQKNFNKSLQNEKEPHSTLDLEFDSFFSDSSSLSTPNEPTESKTIKVKYYKSKTACNFDRIASKLDLNKTNSITENDNENTLTELKAFIYAKLSQHVFEILIGEQKETLDVSQVYAEISDERFEQASRSILTDLEELPGYKFIVSFHSCVDTLDLTSPIIGFSKSETDSDNGDFEVSYVFNWDFLNVLAVVFAIKKT